MNHLHDDPLANAISAALMDHRWHTRWRNNQHGAHHFDGSCAICSGDLDAIGKVAAHTAVTYLTPTAEPATHCTACPDHAPSWRDRTPAPIMRAANLAAAVWDELPALMRMSVALAAVALVVFAVIVVVIAR